MKNFLALVLLVSFVHGKRDGLDLNTTSVEAHTDKNRFVESNTSNTIIDKYTNLEWQDMYTTDEIQWQEFRHWKPVQYSNWSDAIDYCENLELDGFNDWRLPNRNELLSIVDYNNRYPSADSIFKTFHSVIFGDENDFDLQKFWTSTCYEFFNFPCYIVSFDIGYSINKNFGSLNYVKCVRDKK